MTHCHRSGSGVLQSLGIPQKSQALPPREENETGIDLVVQHREVYETAQTLVQLNTTPRDEPQLPTEYEVASSQTGAVENDVSDNAIFTVSPRSSTPVEYISTDILSLLSATISNIQPSTPGCPNSSVIRVANTPLP